MKRHAIEPLYAIFIDGKFAGRLLSKDAAEGYVESYNLSSRNWKATRKRVPNKLVAELVSKL